MTAEDLAGGDDEYVRWAGEFRLMERLQAKLQRLQEVEYSDPGLPSFRSGDRECSEVV